MIEQTLKGELLKMSETQRSVEEELLAKQNVVGVALGNKIKAGKDTGKSALLVLVNQKLAPDLLADDDKVKPKYAEIPTDVMEVGDIFAGGGPLPASEEEVGSLVLTKKVRPAMGGYSVGHPNITAGTIATCCYDAQPFPSIPGRYYILSNNHVLADCNDASIGDPIYQPGPFDGGGLSDVIAHLSAFVPIQWIPATGTPPCNYVDAAIAQGPFHDLNREIYWIGYVKGYNFTPQVGDIVEKTGRTTNFTTGRVLAVNATVNVNYGAGRMARFCRQILTTRMSAGGDSGSLVCDLNERAVGLLFAGSWLITVVNHIRYVVNLLHIRITEN